MLFTALKAEMARKGLKGTDIANTLHISTKSAYNKINGITEFTLKETIQIGNSHFPGMTINSLFSDGDNKQAS